MLDDRSSDRVAFFSGGIEDPVVPWDGKLLDSQASLSPRFSSHIGRNRQSPDLSKAPELIFGEIISEAHTLLPVL
jgi:hypothetical protein